MFGIRMSDHFERTTDYLLYISLYLALFAATGADDIRRKLRIGGVLRGNIQGELSCATIYRDGG